MASRLWLPSDLATLTCWLDVADDNACLPVGVTPATYTLDKSTSRFSLPSGSTRTALLNGKKYYSSMSGVTPRAFPSSTAASYGNADAWTKNKSSLSVYWVARRSGGSTNGPFFTANNFRVNITQSSTLLTVGGLRLDANSYQSMTASVTGFAFNILGAIYDWANARLFIDANGTVTERSGGFQTAGTTSNTDQVMRLLSANSVEYWLGDFCEFLTFSTVLSDTDRFLVEGYLAHKWGITVNLPVSHPWKNDAPTIYGSVTTPGIAVTVDGVVTVLDEVAAVVTVYLFDWLTGERIDVVLSDEAGNWTAQVIADHPYGVTYFSTGCQPVTHGPYTVSP